MPIFYTYVYTSYKQKYTVHICKYLKHTPLHLFSSRQIEMWWRSLRPHSATLLSLRSHHLLWPYVPGIINCLVPRMIGSFKSILLLYALTPPYTTLDRNGGLGCTSRQIEMCWEFGPSGWDPDENQRSRIGRIQKISK